MPPPHPACRPPSTKPNAPHTYDTHDSLAACVRACVRTLGSGAPIPCPNGTSSSSFYLYGADQCIGCPAGFYCPDVGTNNATVLCTEGFYCPGKDSFPSLCVRSYGAPAKLFLAFLFLGFNRADVRCAAHEWHSPLLHSL